MNQEDSSLALTRLQSSQPLGGSSSLKGRLATLQKLLVTISRNLDTYKKQVATLRAAKDSFEGVFDAKNNDTKKTVSNEIDRIAEELKRHLNHQKGENSRIQMQLSILRTEKTDFQNRLKIMRDKIQQIEREVGEG